MNKYTNYLNLNVMQKGDVWKVDQFVCYILNNKDFHLNFNLEIDKNNFYIYY